MNIFYLDTDPLQAAAYHCDKHVVKMIVETSQIISTVFHRYGLHKRWMMKPCYFHRPCTVWAGDSAQNLFWTICLGVELTKEYTIRYGKDHSCSELLQAFKEMVLCHDVVPFSGFTTPSLAMPDECKKGDPVESYREYYRIHKARFATWKTVTPPWMTQ